MELTNWLTGKANKLVDQILAVATPRQLVGLQDVLCLVVDDATSLAYFVFSHNGSWFWSANLMLS